MAKRFTDTSKWNKEWYRKLGSKLRDIRQYLLDNCDHAGIWDVDLETVRHFTGSKVTREDISTALRGREIEISPSKIFIPDFVEFQYGTLQEHSKPHKSVIERLKFEGVWEPFAKGMQRDKDKDQVKDKEKDKEAFAKIREEIKNTPLRSAAGVSQ